MEAREILEQVKNGRISVDDAEKYFKRQPFEDMGYAKLDSHREIRSGFPEVVFCSGKPDEYLKSIYQKLYELNGEVLVQGLLCTSTAWYVKCCQILFMMKFHIY